MEIPGFMITFSDGTAEMSITELDHQFSFAKQSVMALIRRATRHGFCVEHALHEDRSCLAADLAGGGCYSCPGPSPILKTVPSNIAARLTGCRAAAPQRRTISTKARAVYFGVIKGRVLVDLPSRKPLFKVPLSRIGKSAAFRRTTVR